MLPSNWPDWVLIPLMLGLTLVLTVIGLALEPAAQAIAPQQEPTSQEVGFPPRLPYAAPMSTSCLECHIDETSLRDGGVQEEDLDRLLINPEEHSDNMALHSRLGCVTCHGGIGGTRNVNAAHQDLVPNPSHPTEADTYCLPCHHDLRVEIPEHNIRTPHDRIMWGIHEDEKVCSCSNCHGPVAHGEEPIRTHEFLGGYCIDCHEEQDVPPERLKCSGCHFGPHDVSEAIDCETCHVSTELWSKVELAIHPMDLTGQHAELECFECHIKPDFRHISGFTCSDCHTKPHEFGGEDCLQCHVEGGGWSEVETGEGGFDHEAIWDGYRFHDNVACQGCHFEGYEALPSDCEDCHTTG